MFLSVILSGYISVYELSFLRTLFLDSFILFLDPKPLHVSAVFCFSHHQVATELKDLVTQILNTYIQQSKLYYLVFNFLRSYHIM
jgi:hypothetical protein